LSIYKLVACDTDSIKICRTDGKPMSQEEQDNILKRMDSKTPELIRLEEDGYYEKFLVIKSKNYVTYDGKKTKYKGSSIKDQKKEPALRKFMNSAISLIMNHPEDYNLKLQALYQSYCRKALEIDNINDWAVKKTVTRSVINETTSGQANINAAIKGRGFSEGDKIWLYVKEDPEKPADVNKKKYALIEDFGGEYHIWHYVKRVYDTLSILENLIDIKQFIKYHNKSNRSKLEELCNESKKEEEEQKSAG